MGSFIGHAIPGAFFVIFGCWWIIQVYRRYFRGLSKKHFNNGPGDDGVFRSTPMFPVSIGSRPRVKIECHMAVTACLIGMTVELLLSPIRAHGHFFGGGNVQHATMYFFFMLPPLAALVLPRVSIVHNPDMLCYLLLALAFTVEGLLFKFHLYGRDDVDVLIHTLLVYTVFATVAVVLLEMTHVTSLLLALSRGFLTLLQGTWFFQAGFLLYPPWSSPWSRSKPDHDDEQAAHGSHGHDQMMLITCAFTWHLGLLLVLTLVCGASIGYYYKQRYGIDESKVVRSGLRTTQYSVLQNEEADDDV